MLTVVFSGILFRLLLLTFVISKSCVSNKTLVTNIKKKKTTTENRFYVLFLYLLVCGGGL